MEYFKSCQTTDEAKAKFKKLSLELHPDKGGSTADFQEMLNQFQAFKPGKEKFEGEAEGWAEFSGIYASIIEQLLAIDGVEVEVVGSYIWLGGNTYPVKSQITAVDTEGQMECRFASKKKKWFFKPTGYRPKTRKEYDMDSIRNLYGSQTVKGSGRKKLD